MGNEIGSAVLTLDVDDTRLRMGLTRARTESLRGLEQTGKKMQAVGTGMVTAGQRMTRGLTLPIVGVSAALGKMGSDYEAEMQRIVGLVGVSQDQVNAWKEDIQELAPEVAKAPKELAEAMFFVTSAGFKGAEAMDVLKASAQASAAGLGETKVVADAVTSAVNAYGIETLSAEAATDALVAAVREGKLEADALAGAIGRPIPLAAELGISFNEVSAAMAAMSRTGTDANTAATQARAIFSSLIKPTVQSSDAMKEFGFNSEMLRKHIREKGLLATLQMLMDVTDGNVEKLAEIFPNVRALTGVLDMMGANAEDNVEIFESLENSTGSLNKAFEVAAETAEFQFKRELVKLQAEAVKAGRIILPMLINTVQILSGMMTGLVAVFSKLPPELQSIIMYAGLTVAALGPFLIIGGYLVKTVGSLFVGLSKIGAVMFAIPRLTILFVGALKIMVAKVAIAISSLGVLKGTLFTLGMILRAHPIMAIATGIFAAGVAVEALTGKFRSLIGVQEDSDLMNRRLITSSEAIAEREKERTEALEGLAVAEDRLTKAKQRDHKATEKVEAAEERLSQLRNQYPDDSEVVLNAQADLIGAKVEERDATVALRRAERVHGLERKVLMRLMRQDYKIIQDRIAIKRAEVSETRRTLQVMMENEVSTERLRRAYRRFVEARNDVNRAQREGADLLNDASTRIHPRFATSLQTGRQHLRSFADMTQTMKGKNEEVARQLDGPFVESMRSAKNSTGELRGSALFLGRSFIRTRNAAGRGIAGIESDLGGAARALKIDAPTFGLKRRQAGGTVIPGFGTGDKVPVHVAGRPAALMEPGEGLFAVNRRAMSYLNMVNSSIPRHQAGGVIQAGKMGQSMGLNVWQHPAFPPLGSGHTAGSYHFSGQAIDVYGDPGLMRSYFHRVFNSWFGSGLAELFHDPIGWYVKHDSIVQGAIGGHGGHVHVAILGDVMGQAIRASIEGIDIEGPDGPLKDLAQGSIDWVTDAANEWLENNLPMFGGGSHPEGIPAGAMAKGQIANLWSRVNPGLGDPNLMAAIAMAESSGIPTNIGDGGASEGLWQINTPSWGNFGGRLLDPEVNARAAGKVLREQGLSAWTVYNTGAYRQFLKEGGMLNLPGFQGGGMMDVLSAISGAAQGNLRQPAPSGIIQQLLSTDGKRHRALLRNVGNPVTPIPNLLDAEFPDAARFMEKANFTEEMARRASQLTSTHSLDELIKSDSLRKSFERQWGKGEVERIIEEMEPHTNLALFGRAGGKTELSWLQDHLENLLSARNQIVGRLDQVQKHMDEFRKRMQALIDRIKKQIQGRIQHANNIINEATRRRRLLQRRMRQLENRYQKLIDTHSRLSDLDTSNLSRGQRQTRANRLRTIRSQVPALRGEMARISPAIEKLSPTGNTMRALHERRNTLSSHLDDLAKPKPSSALSQDSPGRLHTYKENNLSAFGNKIESLTNQLDSIQGGYASKSGRMTRVPSITSSGGSIFDTQIRLQRLGQETQPPVTPEGFGTEDQTQAMRIPELIRFAETARLMSGLGEFKGFLDRGANLLRGQFGIAGERGPEIIRGPATVTGRQDTAGLLNPEFHVYVGNREITDIVRVEMKNKGRSDRNRQIMGKRLR